MLDEGTVLEAEPVVSSVGDVPNTEWFTGTGLADRGVVRVDPRGLGRPDIADVGDLAEFPTPRGVRRIPLWSSAIEQAKAAERVSLTQSAMSHALGRMRRLLNDELLVRQGGGATLTPRALELVGPLRATLQ